MSNAVHALGTTLSRNGNVVAELTSIGGPKLAADTVDVTNLGSSEGFREFVQGLKDGGEVAIEGSFIPGDTNGQAGLVSDYTAGTIQSFEINFPAATGASWFFNAIITAFESTAPFDGKLAFTATLKVTGRPILNVGASTGLTTPFFTISGSATITPAASGSVYNYVANVTAGISSITVTPTASAGIITVNGDVVSSGQASSEITLGAAGSVTVITIVVKETSKAAKTYTINLARAAS